MQFEYKIVTFYEYCEKCKHKKKQESEEPCNECLSNPVNAHSHKPLKFEEKN